MKNMPKLPKMVDTTPTRLTALETRQAELEARIAELERAAARQMPAPWMPGTPPYTPCCPTPEYAKNGGQCHICGGKWSDMTHYVCSHDRCPSRVWYGDPLQPTFTCGGASSSATTDALTVPKGGPYGAPSTVFDKNMLAGHGIATNKLTTQ